MRSPLYILHKPIVESIDPDAKYSPSPENAILPIKPECPVRVFIRSPLDTFHNTIVSSKDPEAMYSPFLENDTLIIFLKCPIIVFKSWISL